MKCRDIDFSITVGEKPLEEYDVAFDGEKRRATCWIASEAGAEFHIKIDNHLHTHGLGCKVYMDGQKVAFEWTSPRVMRIIKGAPVTAGTEVPFIFSQIQLTDDETLGRSNMPNIEALGTIMFTVLRGTEKRKESLTPRTQLTNLGPLHERTKKAGGHCISLGNERQHKTLSVIADYLDTEDKPYCTFLFRYRPRDLLQAQGIIPLPPAFVLPQPTPEPQEARDAHPKSSARREEPKVKEESDSSESDDEDTNGLLARLDAMAADMAAIRAQMSKKKDKRARKRVKREPSPILLKTSGDVVDLTLD